MDDAPEITPTPEAPKEPMVHGMSMSEWAALQEAQAAHARGMQLLALSRQQPVVAELIGENEALKTKASELEAKVAELIGENDALKANVAELEATKRPKK